MTAGRPVTIGDLTGIRWPLDPAITPDGTALAYVVSGPDAGTDRLDYRLHVVSIDSGDSQPVASGVRARLPRWSPGRKRLAFLAEADGVWQLAFDRVGDGAVSLPGGVADYDWSPDGSRMIASGPGGGPGAPATAATHLGLIDVESAELVAMEPHPFAQIRDVRWSPGGAVAAIGTTPSGLDSLSILEVDTGEWVEVHAWDGPMNSIAWSVDGAFIAMSGHGEGRGGWVNNALWVVDPGAGTAPRRLAPTLDRSIGQAVRGDDERGIAQVGVRWDSDRVLAVFADGGRSVLAAFGLDDSIERLVEGERSVLDFDVARTGAIAVSWSDLETPGEVSVVRGAVEKVVTDVSAPWSMGVRLAHTNVIEATTEDGNTVEGWLTEPFGSPGPVPLVVQVHGGPHYPVGHRFSFDAQRLAAQGVAMLRCNPRGAQGYGSGHAAGIHRDWGGADFRDLMAIVDRAAALDGIDGERVGIIGESYGGFMVSWALAHSDRFAVGVSDNGISDLTSLGSGANGPGFWHLEMGGSPEQLPDLYRQRSPITHAASIRAPLLLVHAEEDQTCPIGQSEALREAIASGGGDVSLVRIPGEQHFVNVYGRPSSRVDKMATVDRFLLDHLGVRQQTGSSDRHHANQPGGGQ